MAWTLPAARRGRDAQVRYTGPLAAGGKALVLRMGYDGWELPVREVAMQRADDGSWTASLPDAEGHIVVDCVVTEGERCDNNGGTDYRLWIGLDPVDSHVHVRLPGSEPMGFESLTTALSSGGMTHALVSWQDNEFVDKVTAEAPWLSRLVWVRPGGPSVAQVRRRLSRGTVGLKLHPVYDNFAADSAELDPYLRAAEDAQAPVTVHSSPGNADPDLIRRLGERFPDVSFVLYHTFLGPDEGRQRAARHARELANLFLETSWCGSATVERMIDDVGSERVMFGSDAAVDGSHHFVREPPNLELSESYNRSLLVLARRLEQPVLKRLLEDNTRRVFRLGPPKA
jgi:predicted TIM-barrel fold metal-dependent hydrolase